MARLSHTRTSRTVVTIVVLTITAVAAIEFYRTRSKPLAAAPKLSPGVLQIAQRPALAPAPKPTELAVTSSPITPVITETPDPTKPAPILPTSIPPTLPPPTLWSTNQNASTVLAANTTLAPKPTAKPASYVELPATSELLTKAKTQIEAGDLLGARKMLNDALLTGTLSGTDTDAVKRQIADINQTVIFSPRPFPKDPLGGTYQVKAGEKLSTIGAAHGVPFEFLMMLNRMTDSRKLRYGQTLKIIDGPFHVVVSKSKFTLDLYLGSPAGQDSTYVTTFPVGLGTDNSTPTGSWVIKNKVPHPAYFPPDGHPGGVLDPDDPKNPLGPCWMGLEGTDGQAVGQRSYGIHGTIDPTSIGKQSSMGCIRLHNEDVEVVYKMLVPGKSTVVVKD